MTNQGKQIHFWLRERTSNEYVLYGQLVGEGVVEFYTWDTLPSREVLEKIMRLIVESMRYYHESLEIPPFAMHTVHIGSRSECEL